MAQQFEPTIGDETNWVRSVYVYAVCLISMVVILAGAALTVGSAVTIISPSTRLSSAPPPGDWFSIPLMLEVAV